MRVHRVAVVVLGVAALGLVPASAAGQGGAVSASTGADVPRTAWGDPDLQGIWTGSTLTPFERPPELGDRAYLTEEEAAALEAEAEATQFEERTPREGDPGTYNRIWFDSGTAIVPDRRTSLIVEPVDGRIPYTAAAAARQADNRDRRVNGPRETWLDIDTGERCITDGLPMIWQGYNPNHQIFQTPDHVVIVHEMFRDRRIIPLDRRPHGSVRQWNGDRRGWWEGDTLVVESTNFVDKSHYRWVDVWREPSETLHLVERFTRVDAHTIEYQATITDPSKFTDRMVVEVPLTNNQEERGVTVGNLYEYACHEGNYSIVNVLTGARSEEAAARATNASR